MYFDKFISTFNSPTSTTSKLQIAAIFANDGVVLELTKYVNHDIIGRRKKLRYFNCSFLSSFGNEDERLFIQPPLSHSYLLKTVGIINMRTNEVYRFIIKVLGTMENVFTDKEFKEAVPEKEMNKMNDILNGSYHGKNEYIQKLLQKWKENMFKIVMDRDKLIKYVEKLAIWDRTVDNLILFDLISSIFKNVKYISLCNTGTINASYFKSLLDVIKRVNQLEHSTLNDISLWNMNKG
eukprot:91492_1